MSDRIDNILCLEETYDNLNDHLNDNLNNKFNNNLNNKLNNNINDVGGKAKPGRFSFSDETRTKLVIGIFSLTIACEVIAKKMNYPSPTHYLSTGSTHLIDTFLLIGKYIYIAFNHITTYINVKDIAVAIYDIMLTICKIVFSPYALFVGLYRAAIVNINESPWVIASGVGCVSLILTVLQINTSSSFKPSNILRTLGTVAMKFYEYFGRFISDISSFYRVLKLNRFMEALHDVLHPIVTIVVTPAASTIHGYVTEINKYKYGKYGYGSGLIGLGSLTLLALALYVKFLQTAK